MARRTSVTAGLPVLALILDGCSIAFVTPAPKTAALEAPACTNDYISPVLDTLILGAAPN